jgi:lipopolysaccharide/colanic/teichoic acid biosynthesis glycosyltransferase
MVRSLSLLVKRALDVTVAAAALLILSPLLLVTALLIVLEDGRPVFFRQNRAGRGGKAFSIFKFRSMTPNDAPVAMMGAVTGSHPLVTRVGRVIRRTKIDELPQLLNVLTGDLSLVGPRPTLLEQVAEYDDFERRRLLLKPGVTGWAQVGGGIYLPWEERIALDVWYIDHWSLRLDFEVLLRTVGVIIFGEKLNHKARAAALEHERTVYGHGAVRLGGWRSEKPLG